MPVFANQLKCKLKSTAVLLDETVFQVCQVDNVIRATVYLPKQTLVCQAIRLSAPNCSLP